MKTLLGIYFACAVLILVPMPKAYAKCSNTSAFRYEFENWSRDYILETIVSLSEVIVEIYNKTLMEVELAEAQTLDFQKSHQNWHDFLTEMTELLYKSKTAKLDEIVKEFRLKLTKFEPQKDVLGGLATKDVMNKLDELENVTEIISKKYADDIFEDWREFYKRQDLETLSAQSDCIALNLIMDTMQKTDKKLAALKKMSLELFEIFGMDEWTHLLPSPNDSCMY